MLPEIIALFLTVAVSYYRRFRLYKYIFTTKVIRQFQQVLPQEVEFPMVFPSLGGAAVSMKIEPNPRPDEAEFVDVSYE
jgi:hypothetical protein